LAHSSSLLIGEPDELIEAQEELLSGADVQIQSAHPRPNIAPSPQDHFSSRPRELSTMVARVGERVRGDLKRDELIGLSAASSERHHPKPDRVKACIIIDKATSISIEAIHAILSRIII